VEELQDAARGEFPERVFDADAFGEVVKPDALCSLGEEYEVGRLGCDFPGCSLSTRERISACHAGVKYSSANRMIVESSNPAANSMTFVFHSSIESRMIAVRCSLVRVRTKKISKTASLCDCWRFDSAKK